MAHICFVFWQCNHHIKPTALRATQKAPSKVTKIRHDYGIAPQLQPADLGGWIGQGGQRADNFVDVVIGE